MLDWTWVPNGNKHERGNVTYMCQPRYLIVINSGKIYISLVLSFSQM